MIFAKTLTQWYLQHKRDLPWRNNASPYQIWLSEIILQQTRVAQGMPYYLAFVEAFPTVFDLANASEQQVLKLWQGLGYYSRARNLHKTAQKIATDLNGIFPTNYFDLLNLNGVGDYTASAIASFAYNERVPVVDGNVFRVLARYIGVEEDIAQAKTRKTFQLLAIELMMPAEPNLFNQAIMEFGALQCVPKNPNCAICPFNVSCYALKFSKVGEFPVKSKKAKPISKHFNYLVYIDENQKIPITQRTEKGIWQNLYEFPLIESETELQNMAQPLFFINKIIDIQSFNEVPIIHKLTHQHLNIKFWIVNVEGKIDSAKSLTEIKTYPFPIVIHNFLESLQL